MFKSALGFHLTSIVFTSPIIFVGMVKYNLKEMRESRKELKTVTRAIAIFSLLPLVNITIATINFAYLITGDSRDNETR